MTEHPFLDRVYSSRLLFSFFFEQGSGIYREEMLHKKAIYKYVEWIRSRDEQETWDVDFRNCTLSLE
jgi:outer membrane protease